MKLLSFITALLLSFPNSLASQQATSSPSASSTQAVATPQRDPQAVAVLAQAIATMAPALTAVQDALIQGSYSDQDGTKGTITIKCKGPLRLRHDIDINGHHQTMVVRDGAGNATNDGKPNPLPLWATKYARPDHLVPFSRLADYSLSKTNVLYVGLEQVGDRSVHHVRVSSLPTDDTPARIEDLMSEFHLFIDAQSFLLVKTISFYFSPEIVENRATVETFYDDWRPINGVAIPFHEVRFIYGQKFSEVQINTVSLNVGLTDAEFE